MPALRQKNKHYRDHRALGFKPGDSAWVYFLGTDPPYEVRITGPCDDDMGHGYEATGGPLVEIHTCNGFLTKSKAQARKEYHKYLSQYIDQQKKTRKNATDNITWAQWVLKGNHF